MYSPATPSARQSKVDVDNSIGELRQALESLNLSNGPPPSPKVSPHVLGKPGAIPYQRYRSSTDASAILDRKKGVRLDIDTAQTTETLDVSPQLALASSNVSSLSPGNISDQNLNFKYSNKSPQPDKAKQIMGLEPAKKLPSNRKFSSEDGNIAALESEYFDIFVPQKEIIDEKEGEFKPSHQSEETERIKETAKDIFNGTELFVGISDATNWLMNTNEFNTKVRIAYMELFDFIGLDILTAMRCLH
jgi:hypothetical protein